MNLQCDRFKIDDIVSFGIIPNARFYGIVKQVDPKINKIFVDINGKITQFDPEELQIVLEESLMKQARRASKKTALYWSQSPRKYKKTQSESETGEIRCPKCKSVMNTSKFTRSNKLYVCPDCDFKIISDSIVEDKSQFNDEEIRMSNIASKIAQVNPLKNKRDYGEQSNSMNERIEMLNEMTNNSQKIDINKITSSVYKYLIKEKKHE